MLVELRRIVTSGPFVYVFSAALLLCALLGRVMARTTLVRLGYELSALEDEHQKLQTDMQALRTELAARRAPDRMAKDGRQRFHLELARPEQVVTVRSMDDRRSQP